MKQSDKPDLPNWSAYLAKLGEQAKRHDKAKTAKGVGEQHVAKSSPKPVERKDGPRLRYQHQDGSKSEEPVRQPPATPHPKPNALHERGHPPVGKHKEGIHAVHTSANSGQRLHKTGKVAGLVNLLMSSGNKFQQLISRLRGRDKRTTPVIEEPLQGRITLGFWGFYFAAKLGMFWKELIGFHPLPNLLFAAFILYPVKSRFWLRIKNMVTGVLALGLLYHDSWFPPVTRIFEKSSSLSHFSMPYTLELLSRFVNWPIIGMLVGSGLIYRFAARRMRVGVLVIVSMLAVWVAQSQISDWMVTPLKSHEQVASVEERKPDLDAVLKSFFDKEAERSVSFVTPPVDAVPFDVVFIHICSLSWDDVRAVGLEQHPLWKKFDILFKRFSSAASYSGPAVIHLLRATCGQQKHEKMYFAAPDKCYLMGSLQRSGFEPNLALNHNGKFDDFLGMAQRHGQLTAPPLSHDGLPVELESFYGAPLYDDLTVWNRWLQQRQASTSERVALFYNTASLHDGNHLPGSDALPNTLDSYKARLVKFLDELDQFMNSLEQSGRRTVVVMVPEHGGAVLGDKKQIAGLREIPTPAISLVPVGIRVIGGNIQRQGDTLQIDKPTSFLAIAHILARMLARSPYNEASFTPSYYVENLPLTQFVSQNEKMTVLEYSNRYYLSDGTAGWEDYAEFNPPSGE